MNYLLMQINDSTFPIGSYTQSYGLETYVVKGLISSAEDALSYILAYMWGQFLYTDLLAVSLAYDAKEHELVKLDRLLLAVMSAREVREASIKLGRRFIKTVEALDVVFLRDTYNMYIKEHANYTVAYGAFCASVGASKLEAMECFVYSSMSAMVTNIVKLVPLSQTEGQRMLFNLAQYYEELIRRAMMLDENYLGLSAPGNDVRCMQHEVLYSRQYMS
ncbi:MAG: hypothetical protein BEN18_10695 [Epulopiscium sp. Nuni2H_MBin001]|nr:MAG: hypothetical protein BEN18_10695 [Epulopiscium sp. Nuni2H_MBin001]